MKKILLIMMFAFSLFVLSNCGEEEMLEGQEKHLESDSRLERGETRNLREFREVERGQPEGEEFRRGN